MPSLESETLGAVGKHLATKIGVKCVADLDFVDIEKDLNGILLPVDSRKFAHFFASFRQQPGKWISD